MYSCVWTVTGSATKLKTGICMLKQREQLRTLNASQTNNSICDSMHASAVRAVFGPPLPVLSFVTDYARWYVYACQFYATQLPVFSSKFGNNCLEHNIT